MARLVIDKHSLKEFFETIHVKSGKSWDEIGKLVNLSGRTIRDWRRGSFLPHKLELEKLAAFYKVELPVILEEREDYWTKKYARKGALAKLKLYGPPGTQEGRRKGGLISQQKRRENPEFYRKLGVIVRNKISHPRHSSQLAELIGVILGDGGLTRDQCFISLNCIRDKHYSWYVKKLIKTLFQITPSIYLRPKYGTVTVAVSGRDFIDFLIKEGLRVGNKVKNQVDVPDWIKNKAEYMCCCLRGLMDTDGGVFTHNYKINNKLYSYKKICFTNKSQPLLDFVYNSLNKLNLHPKKFSDNKIWIYSGKNVIKYFNLVGSSNQRLLQYLMMI